MKLDQTNVKLVRLLQENARSTYSDLARQLSRAETTIRERVQLLEQRGAIRDYRATVDPAKVGFPLRAVLDVHCELSKIQSVTAKLRSIPNVVRASATSGSRPLSIEVVAPDLKELELVIERDLAPLGFTNLSLRLELQNLMEERPAPIEPSSLPEASWTSPRPQPSTAPGQTWDQDVGTDGTRLTP